MEGGSWSAHIWIAVLMKPIKYWSAIITIHEHTLTHALMPWSKKPFCVCVCLFFFLSVWLPFKCSSVEHLMALVVHVCSVFRHSFSCFPRDGRWDFEVTTATLRQWKLPTVVLLTKQVSWKKRMCTSWLILCAHPSRSPSSRSFSLWQISSWQQGDTGND